MGRWRHLRGGHQAGGDQHWERGHQGDRSSQETASIIHVSPSSVYVIFPPNLSGEQNTPGATPPAAAKMRTKKAGDPSRAGPTACADQ